MARDRRTKSAAADRRRPQKKKVSILNTEGVDWIDYKDARYCEGCALAKLAREWGE